jgi:hypothetical protein
MQRPLPDPNAGYKSAVVLLKPLRLFCGWGYPRLGRGTEQPIEKNSDIYFLIRVPQGAVTLMYGNGRMRPHRTEVGPGDLFNVWPLNFWDMRHASSGEWATLRGPQHFIGEPGAVPMARRWGCILQK